ncbi:MAG: class I tRNA ligase family protein, partial [Eudoraea sp.]|nr:class I tRNA ligase family protein [Eudoraea sp.]
DKERRKMSKQLGKSPDALKLIEDYGADGVRVGLMLSAAAGNDLLFEESLCQQGKNFANKIWNAFRLVKGWEVTKQPQPDAAALGVAWYEAKFANTLTEIEDHFAKFRISDALMAIYKLIWDDFCSWFLEIVKPAYQQPIDEETYVQVISLFEKNLKILHPFMPFLSEEVWQCMSDRSPQEALVVSSWPKVGKVDSNLLTEFRYSAEVISGIRTIRKEKNIPLKESLSLQALNTQEVSSRWDSIIKKLANISSIDPISAAPEGAISFRVKSNEYFVPVSGSIDIAAEIKKIKEELTYTRGFLRSVEKKLSNERFVNNAPEQVVAMEKKKAMDAEEKIVTLEKSLAGLAES